MPQLPLLALLLVLASNQSNVCYANCKKGYCASNNSNLCSDCDLGTLNIDGSCLSSNIQPVSDWPFRVLSSTTSRTRITPSWMLTSSWCNSAISAVQTS